MNVLDLFCGCGGLSYGFECAGFNILLGIDNDAKALETFELNHKNSKSICGDITHITFEKDIKPLIGDKKIDVIIGGPPCQGMSLSGLRKFDDPRNSLYLSYIRLVDEIRPKAFVIENVPGLIGLFNGQIKDSIIDSFTKMGYNIKFKILCASEYGVPQNRRRVVFVGLKKGEFTYPSPLNETITCEMALSDLPTLEDNIGTESAEYLTLPQNDYQKLMRRNSDTVHNHVAANHSAKVQNIIALVPDGGNYKDLPAEYINSRNFHVAWTRFASQKPAPTIDTGHRHHFHYKFNRVPTVRECARLQSFPDSFIFLGNKTQQFRQVGNAVPPLLAQCLAKSLKKQLEGYNSPDEYYIRLHHCRPRFKGDIENVLIYMAEEISKLPELPCDEYDEQINQAIRCFPGNINKTLKTINNWRTEISSLFGFIQTDGKRSKAGLRAKELAEKQDLIECFKMFLYNFQYPGAHIKSHEILKLIKAGVKFKPAQYLLKILKYAEDSTGKRQYITKAEFCHCIFNDLRCVRDNEDSYLTWNRIIANRENAMEYDQTGDVIRYAGDIIDYMEIANLLVTHDGCNFYINTLENAAILKFINSNDWFSDYDKMIEKRSASLEEINSCKERWFNYVNRDIADRVFETNVLAFISSNETEYAELHKQSLTLYDKKLENTEKLRTKDIGDIGESLVFGHECQRIKLGGRDDLIHLIKRIPTQLAVGYDIQSVELDERKRYIEVKSTISSKPLHFNKIHLTPNEWHTAQTVNDRYFVYRLMISKTEKKLYILQDPVRLYKNDLIDMSIKDGADITFYPHKSGDYEELLSWQS